MKLSVSPSKIEQFRLHVTEAYCGTITKEKVIEAVKGLTPWSPKMEFGGAFHKVCEFGSKPFLNPVTGMFDVPIEDFQEPFKMSPEEVAVADEYRSKYPNMVHEIKDKLIIPVNGDVITMYMRIDSMNGYDVHEKKTTDRLPTRDKYEDSLQWRCYAIATGAKRVIYDVFHYDNKVPRNINLHQFAYEPYPTMKQELENWLKQFILFCQNEDLMEFIKSKYQ